MATISISFSDLKCTVEDVFQSHSSLNNKSVSLQACATVTRIYPNNKSVSLQACTTVTRIYPNKIQTDAAKLHEKIEPIDRPYRDNVNVS